MDFPLPHKFLTNSVSIHCAAKNFWEINDAIAKLNALIPAQQVPERIPRLKEHKKWITLFHLSWE